MSLSNYEIMRNQMRGEFIKYDQGRMIRKFALNFDERYLYIDFVCRRYRIGRKTGIAEWSEDAFQTVTEADYNESMTIYDVLCYSKENCHPANKFCSLHMAKGIAKTLNSRSGMFQSTAEKFRGRTKQLEYACAALGKPVEMIGDVAAMLWAFPFLPVTLQYWEGDDEFPSTLKFMFDENILDYMHFETVFFMTSHILKRLEEIASTYTEASPGGGGKCER